METLRNFTDLLDTHKSTMSDEAYRQLYDAAAALHRTMPVAPTNTDALLLSHNQLVGELHSRIVLPIGTPNQRISMITHHICWNDIFLNEATTVSRVRMAAEDTHETQQCLVAENDVAGKRLVFRYSTVSEQDAAAQCLIALMLDKNDDWLLDSDVAVTRVTIK